MPTREQTLLHKKDEEIKALTRRLKKTEKIVAADDRIFKHVSHKMRLNAKTDKAQTLLLTIEKLDRILTSDKALHTFTGHDIEEFYWLYDQFEVLSKRDKNAPLFDDDPGKGNRCALTRMHVFMLALHHDHEKITQESIALAYGIDQSTVSRYIMMISQTMDRLLPDPNSLGKEAANCRTKEEFMRWIPNGVLTLDGTRTPHVRSMDPDEQKAMYSGKTHSHTLNTLFAINQRHEIIWMSSTQPGSTHDVVLADELGDVFKFAIKKGWLTIIADAGFQGITNRIPGLKARTSKKRTRGKKGEPKREFTQKRFNKKLAKKRIYVEHAFAKIKNNGITRVPFRGSPEEFNHILNIQAGKVNLHNSFTSICNGTRVIGRFMAEKDKRELKRDPG